MFIFTLGCHKNHHRFARARGSHVNPLKVYEHRQRRQKVTRCWEKGFHALIFQGFGFVSSKDLFMCQQVVSLISRIFLFRKKKTWRNEMSFKSSQTLEFSQMLRHIWAWTRDNFKMLRNFIKAGGRCKSWSNNVCESLEDLFTVNICYRFISFLVFSIRSAESRVE